MIALLEDVKNVIGKIVKFPLENLNWEIQKYFKMTKKIFVDHIKKKLDRPKEEILKNFNLIEENLQNPLYLPEILSLATEIKENNFNEFNRESETYGYNHYNRAYRIKDLINELEFYVEIIEEFRLLYSVKQEPEIKDNFIEIDFEKYGLPEFDEFKESINKAAYDEILFRTVPILLRTIFENLLWYIFKDGLANKHTTLYFNSNKNRIRDFSQLISLLNQLKDKELIPISKNAINSKTVEILIDIQKFGNWNVHEIHNHVGKDFAKNWKEKINQIINSLMMLYKNINGRNIEIQDNGRLKKIHERMGIKYANN